MEEQNRGKTFEYTYSAPTEREKKMIENIRRQYSDEVTTSEDKIARVKYLDGKVKNVAVIWALSLGIVGLLVFGTGMSMVLELGEPFWGVVVAAVGCIPMMLSYPVYQSLIKRGKRKYGEEILRLTEEILQNT